MGLLPFPISLPLPISISASSLSTLFFSGLENLEADAAKSLLGDVISAVVPATTTIGFGPATGSPRSRTCFSPSRNWLWPLCSLLPLSGPYCARTCAVWPGPGACASRRRCLRLRHRLGRTTGPGGDRRHIPARTKPGGTQPAEELPGRHNPGDNRRGKGRAYRRRAEPARHRRRPFDLARAGPALGRHRARRVLHAPGPVRPGLAGYRPLGQAPGRGAGRPAAGQARGGGSAVPGRQRPDERAGRCQFGRYRVGHPAVGRLRPRGAVETGPHRRGVGHRPSPRRLPPALAGGRAGGPFGHEPRHPGRHPHGSGQAIRAPWAGARASCSTR